MKTFRDYALFLFRLSLEIFGLGEAEERVWNKKAPRPDTGARGNTGARLLADFDDLHLIRAAGSLDMHFLAHVVAQNGLADRGFV